LSQTTPILNGVIREDSRRIMFITQGGGTTNAGEARGGSPG